MVHTELPPPLLPPLASQVEFIEDPNLREEKSLKQKQDLQIVRSQNLPNEILKERTPKDKVRFFSESDQTVLEEQRVEESGLTENRAPESTQQNAARETTAKEPLTKDRLQKALARNSGAKDMKRFHIGRDYIDRNHIDRNHIDRNHIDRDHRFFDNNSKIDDLALNNLDLGNESDEDGRRESNQRRPLKFPPMNAYQLNSGRSTVGEMLPNDIRFGQMTALNTDRFTYYSFYSRAEELIRPHWETQVRSVLYTYERTSAVTGDELWLTRLEIILDKEGRFLKGVVDQRSGLDGLDLSPILAFRAAGQIPHPPPELVAADGRIHLNYEFTVRYMRQLARGSRNPHDAF